MQIPAGIPQAPITPKMAGLLRMLAHSKLVLAFDRRSYMRKVRLICTVTSTGQLIRFCVHTFFQPFKKTFVNPLERYRFVAGIDDRGTEGFDGKQLLYDASVGIGCL